MPLLTEEEFNKNQDFNCVRCKAKCTKVDVNEPELGYLSRVPGHEGEFIGPLCEKCYNELPDKDKVIKKVPETAFTIVIKPDGEGAYVTSGEAPLYLRQPTYEDIISGCNIVANDIHEAIFAQRLTAQIVRILGSQKSKLVLPK